MSDRNKRGRQKIDRRLPPVGTSLNGRFYDEEYHAIIVAHSSFPQGKAVKYNGTLYRSLTAAAKAITDSSVNGWLFWKIK